MLTLRTRIHACKRSRGEEAGATAVEYALMIGVFSIFIVLSVSVLGQHTTSTFNKVVATWPT